MKKATGRWLSSRRDLGSLLAAMALAIVPNLAIAQEQVAAHRAVPPPASMQGSTAPKNASRSVLVVFANWLDGREDDFNTWYDDHVKKILKVPGFVSAQRYRIVNMPGRPVQRRHLVIYEIDGDPTAALAALTPAVEAGRLTRPDATLMEMPLSSALYNPIGSRLFAERPSVVKPGTGHTHHMKNHRPS